ncbi:DUF4340 domain-containing protein [Aliikangiella coralliicola]|uniref:DUF4340 domain-containing protein n=1 Tax=Aliikangiella coralliicola TaxID=2592383 RepID=A0A545UA41_9GAMM|nr:DUF4340 domain-containing protein [Aliikangiella coralliicola]TQV86347.1 DUF4340 domain-containing protein [Aliikangiella coralliicola]
MNKKISVLYIVLFVQLLIVGVLAWNNSGNDPASSAKPLLEQFAEIDKLTITGEESTTGEEKNQVNLIKTDSGWQITELRNLPANESKTSDLIDNLNSIRVNWPVSTTKSSHTRFEVAEDNFQRKLEIFKGDTLVETLYLGTSPGFRKSHVRSASDSDVYSVKLAQYDVPVKADDWLDKGLLKLADLSAVKGPDYSLKIVGGNWQWGDSSGSTVTSTEGDIENNENAKEMENTQSGLEIDVQKALQFTSKLENLQVLRVAEKSVSGPKLSLEVSTKDSSKNYQFFANEEKYYVKRNDFEPLFEISKTDFDEITQVNQPALTVVKNTPKKEEEEQKTEENS